MDAKRRYCIIATVVNASSWRKDLDRMETLVTEALEKGWQIAGGAVVYPAAGGVQFVQALWRGVQSANEQIVQTRDPKEERQ